MTHIFYCVLALSPSGDSRFLNVKCHFLTPESFPLFPYSSSHFYLRFISSQSPPLPRALLPPVPPSPLCPTPPVPPSPLCSLPPLPSFSSLCPPPPPCALFLLSPPPRDHSCSFSSAVYIGLQHPNQSPCLGSSNSLSSQ